MHRKYSRCVAPLHLSIGAAAAMLMSSAAQAADVPSADGSQLEEIVITAQKRNEDLQQVPISVQAISSQTLSELNYNSLEELTQTVPGVHISTGSFANTLSIRGISSGNNPGFDQSVATFVDDIYHGRSRMSDATFLDLDHIEILKGPQSTYFGNNAIAGALNIVTAKPSDHVEASARALYGQYGQYAIEGAIGGPISETLGARLAIIRSGESGWIDNLDTGLHEPVQNNEAARLTLVFRPAENLDATFKIEGSRSLQTGTAYDQPLQWVNCPPPAPYTPATSAILGQGGCGYALAHNIPIGLDNDNNSELGGQGSSLSTSEDVLTINYHQWGHTFTSVTGFYDYHSDLALSESDLPVALITNDNSERYDQFSQEFRVASPTGQPLEYLAGLYYQTDKLNSTANANAPALTPLLPLIGLGSLVPYAPLSVNVDFPQSEHIYSVFGSLSWNVTDAFKLNAGVRGSWDRKDATQGIEYGTGTQTYGGLVPLPAALQPDVSFLYGTPGALNLSQSSQGWMPSGGMQYQLTPAAMAYFTYSRGFKAGGFNGTSTGGTAAQDIQFGPEHVNAYEVGVKSKWLDDTVLLNLDVFRSNYRGLQVSAEILNPSTNTYELLTKNAAASVAQGVEFETQWAITKDFRLSADVTYLESYYVTYLGSPNTLQSFCGGGNGGSYVLPYCARYPDPVPAYDNLAGQATNYAPRWSGSLTASYGIALPGQYRLTTAVLPYATSAYTANGGNSDDPFFRVGGYVRLDGRLTLDSPDRRWAVDLIGKNLTDRIIVVAPTFATSSKEEPRNISVQFRYHL